MKLFLTLSVVVFAAALIGCKTSQIQHLTIDAITAGGDAAYTGASYRLLPKDPVLARDTLEYTYVAKCVEEALKARGMFLVQGSTPSDLVIELDYGMIPLSIPTVMKSNEHYMRLAARKYRADAASRNFKGEELWDVRVAISKPDDQLVRLFPILAVAAVTYAGLEKQPDSQISIKEDSALVVAVQQAAAEFKPRR